MYGVGGIGQIVSQSKDEGAEKGLGEMYRHHMNHIYSEDLWGAEAGQALSEQLKGNQAVIHSRTTNVYGVLDNDDFYQFVGGLNAASKSVNGAAPHIYVNNLRQRGSEAVEDFRSFLVKEMSTRYWNPKWIREQQRAGYAGARQFIKEMEHLYGWQATSKEQVDGSLWQKSFDVYVADKHGLGMDEFFERVNPHVRQWQLARMLEVDRQGAYRFSDSDRAALIERYVRSVNRHGAACSANTCGNSTLHRYIAEQAPLVSGLGSLELKTFGRRMAAATRWSPAQFSGAPAAFRAGLRAALPHRAAPSSTPPRYSQAPTVSGQVIRETVLAAAAPSTAIVASRFFSAALFVVVFLGALREMLRQA
jgi:cobaltochelatase CobN